MDTEQPKRKCGAPGGELHWNYKHGRRSKVIRERYRAEVLASMKANAAADVKIDYARIIAELDRERRRRGWT